MDAPVSPPAIDPLVVSGEQWQGVYIHDPHTSFNMIKKLMEFSGINHETLLNHDDSLVERTFPGANPDLLSTIMNTEIMASSSVDTWLEKPGRCTSFAVKIAHALEQTYQGTFNFQYFDLGGHRVARCEKTTILIDSVSSEGAKFMPATTNTDSADWRERWRQGRYKYHPDGSSIFEGIDPNGGGQVSRSQKNPIRDAQALSKCFYEVALNKSLVCSFRYVLPAMITRPFQHYAHQLLTHLTSDSAIIDGQPKYLSVIRWRVAKKRIELIPTMAEPTSFHCISFGLDGGNADTLAECMRNFVQFIVIYGNRDQWMGAELSKMNEDLWKAAVKQWKGPPVWISIQ